MIIKYGPCKHEDLSLIHWNHGLNKQTRHGGMYLKSQCWEEIEAGRTLGSLASQPDLINKPRTSERPCLKR